MQLFFFIFIIFFLIVSSCIVHKIHNLWRHLMSFSSFVTTRAKLYLYHLCSSFLVPLLSLLFCPCPRRNLRPFSTMTPMHPQQTMMCIKHVWVEYVHCLFYPYISDGQQQAPDSFSPIFFLDTLILPLSSQELETILNCEPNMSLTEDNELHYLFYSILVLAGTWNHTTIPPYSCDKSNNHFLSSHFLSLRIK